MRIRIRPVPGLLYRDPVTRQHIPADGVEVELNTAWRRALHRGDVEVCEPPRATHSAPVDTAAPSERGGSPTPESGAPAS